MINISMRSLNSNQIINSFIANRELMSIYTEQHLMLVRLLEKETSFYPIRQAGIIIIYLRRKLTNTSISIKITLIVRSRNRYRQHSVSMRSLSFNLLLRKLAKRYYQQMLAGQILIRKRRRQIIMITP